jgi:hypothetical protein
MGFNRNAPCNTVQIICQHCFKPETYWSVLYILLDFPHFFRWGQVQVQGIKIVENDPI